MSKLFVLTAALAISVTGWAGDDSDAIRQAAMDYIQSWYTGDSPRMERALHPELAKRVIFRDAEGHENLNQMSAMTLVNGVRTGRGKQTPEDQRIGKVDILDIYHNIASVKVEMSGWIDYMHLVKSGDEWKIINVLWGVETACH